MKFLIQKSLFSLAVAALIVGCGTEISGNSSEDPDPGSADFSTFVAIGDSLTAGYADSALYRHGQVNSYPAIMAQQFAFAGGGAFAQPLRSADATGSFVGIPTTTVADRLVAAPTGDPERPLTPVPITPSVPTNLVPMPGMLFNNFGVPSAKSFHFSLTSYGDPAGLAAMPPTANPFYVRFATSPGPAGSSIIGDAVARAPTFFVLWVGNNDVLLNALAGSPGTDNPTFGTGFGDATPTATFAAVYPGLVAALTGASPGNKGVLANIPNVSTIPYFTTVPYNAIPLDAPTAAQLTSDVAMVYDLVLNSAIVNGLDPAEAARRRITYTAGDENPILISDDTLVDISSEFVGPLAALIGLAQARPATPDDLILLPAASKLGEEDTPGNPLTVWGVTLPLEDGDVLTEPEAGSLDAVRLAYNATIKAEADADPDLIYFDAAALLEELNSTGISYGSGGISSAFILGGGFSLDGVHPTARGYAVIANEMMDAIEQAFGATLPPVNPADYSTFFYQ